MFRGSQQFLTFNFKGYRLTRVSDHFICASLHFAFIWSPICCFNGFDWIRLFRVAKMFAIFVPLVLPSRGDLNVAAKGDWLSREHHLVFWILRQCNTGFLIWGSVNTNLPLAYKITLHIVEREACVLVSVSWRPPLRKPNLLWLVSSHRTE